MKEAIGLAGDLIKVDVRTATARQLLNHEGEGRRSIDGERDHRRHNSSDSVTARTQTSASQWRTCSAEVQATLLE